MTTIMRLFFISLFMLAQASCGDLKVGPTDDGLGKTDDSKDTEDTQLSQELPGYYEIESGEVENVKFNSEGRFVKVELLKTSSSQQSGCKFNLQGAFAVYKRHEDNRKKFWSDATHEIRARVGNVTFLNANQLNPVDQQNCMNFQKREFSDNVKPVRYFISTSGMRSIRFYNSLGDKLTGNEETPVGTLFKRL